MCLGALLGFATTFALQLYEPSRSSCLTAVSCMQMQISSRFATNNADLFDLSKLGGLCEPS